jgi:hypothetical protein
MYRRFTMEIISQVYGGSDIFQYVVCKLENQESQWYNSLGSQRPGNGVGVRIEQGIGCWCES